MAVMIRLRRMGGRKDPFFRVVATDERRAPSSRYLEDLGWYDPKKEEANVQIKLDRVEYWVGQGAHISDAVRNLIRRYRRMTSGTAAASGAGAGSSAS